MGVDRRRKKKPALTAKEAMVAKAQAQAARKPAKPAAAAPEVEEYAPDGAPPQASTSPAASRPAVSKPAVAKASLKRASSKRTAPRAAPPPEEEEAPALPIKRGFFRRLLDVFRGAPKARGD